MNNFIWWLGITLIGSLVLFGLCGVSEGFDYDMEHWPTLTKAIWILGTLAFGIYVGVKATEE